MIKMIPRRLCLFTLHFPEIILHQILYAITTKSECKTDKIERRIMYQLPHDDIPSLFIAGVMYPSPPGPIHEIIDIALHQVEVYTHGVGIDLPIGIIRAATSEHILRKSKVLSIVFVQSFADAH